MESLYFGIDLAVCVLKKGSTSFSSFPSSGREVGLFASRDGMILKQELRYLVLFFFLSMFKFF